MYEFTEAEWPQLGYPLEEDRYKSNIYMLISLGVVCIFIYFVYLNKPNLDLEKKIDSFATIQKSIQTKLIKKEKELNQRMKNELTTNLAQIQAIRIHS